MKKLGYILMIIFLFSSCSIQYDIPCNYDSLGYSYLEIPCRTYKRAMKLQDEYLEEGVYVTRSGKKILISCKEDLTKFRNSEIKNYKLVE